jgi:hypothetical protein
MPNAVIRPPAKLWVVIVSCILGWFFAYAVHPTPNVAGGGGVHMGVFLVLTVVFKATIEFFVDRVNKKRKR